MAAPKNPALTQRMRPPDVGRAAGDAHHRTRLEHVDIRIEHAESDRAGDTAGVAFVLEEVRNEDALKYVVGADRRIELHRIHRTNVHARGAFQRLAPVTFIRIHVGRYRACPTSAAYLKLLSPGTKPNSDRQFPRVSTLRQSINM